MHPLTAGYLAGLAILSIAIGYYPDNYASEGFMWFGGGVISLVIIIAIPK